MRVASLATERESSVSELRLRLASAASASVLLDLSQMGEHQRQHDRRACVWVAATDDGVGCVTAGVCGLRHACADAGLLVWRRYGRAHACHGGAT
jgi:hypothetical protein